MPLSERPNLRAQYFRCTVVLYVTGLCKFGAWGAAPAANLEAFLRVPMVWGRQGVLHLPQD